LAVLVGLSPLVAVELILRIGGWGFMTDSQDPYVGFSNVHPLFELNQEDDCFEIPKSRQTFFRPESFPAKKGSDDYRIFCLGGSTVQGRPYAIETSFTTWLKISLQAADPSRNWDVINCGGVSYASYRLTPILQEVIRYEPDLLIIYTGQNEFLEDRTYRSIKESPRWQVVAHSWLSRLRTFNALRAMWLRATQSSKSSSPAERASLSDEVEALLDYRGGLEQYNRDDTWRDGCIAHFEFNLRRMVHLAEQAGVPVILVNPVTNLKDTPPFKFSHRDDIRLEDEERCDELWSLARASATALDQRIALLQRALDIDRRHAGMHYQLGKCYYDQHKYDEAKAAFVRAKDEDICPLRIVEPMHEAISLVASDTSATLVDARALFEELTPNGIPGNEWLVDHVHPSIRGHQRLAKLLFDELVELDIIHPKGDWTIRRDAAYKDNFDSLHPLYYYRAQKKLEGLRRWAAGRGDLQPPDKAKTPDQ
jgi:tetratricopeptide (TPR) repeat protein